VSATPPLPSDTFARNLRQERERQGMSQAQLAAKIAEILGVNVDPSAVTRIEKQERAVRLDEAVAAAQALDMPLAALITEEHVRENERLIQTHLLDLAKAERRWEEQRQEVLRLTRIIQTLSADSAMAHDLDPRLKAALDARIPVNIDDADASLEVTDPDE
jgi:transcriptional regulator with XRE-family HTH domain